jgi:acetolactate synthase-1/2/3 large subunit
MLDVRDWEKATHDIERTKRETVPLYPPDCEMIEIGFGDIGISKWSMDYTRMPNCSLRVLGDTATAIPELTRLCRARIAEDPRLAESISKRTRAIGRRHDDLFHRWAQQAQKEWEGVPITVPRLASEIWEAIRNEDWVLTACTLQDWVRSTGPIATRAGRSVPAPRSEFRWASRSRTAELAGSWSTSSLTAT